MAPPQTQTTTNALSPPLTPAFSADTPPADSTPQSRDDTPVSTNENINGRKRSQQPPATTASPKRRRVEGVPQDTNVQQQQTTSHCIPNLNGDTGVDGHRVNPGTIQYHHQQTISQSRSNSNGYTVGDGHRGNPSNGFAQTPQEDHTLRAALQMAEQQLLSEQVEARNQARLTTQHQQQQQHQSPSLSHTPMSMPQSRPTSASPALQQGAWMSPQIQMQSPNFSQHAHPHFGMY